MSKEFRLPPRIEKRRKHLSILISQRESLVGRIGTGAVKEGSSWDNTLKVGRVRRKVKASAERFNGELDSMAQGFAKQYVDLRSLREKQLADMKTMVEEKNLSVESARHFEKEFEELNLLPEKNEFLKRGLGKVIKVEDTGTSIDALDLAPRWANALGRAHINIESLESMTDLEILKIKLIAKTGLFHIKRAIRDYRVQHPKEVSNPRK